MPCTAQHAGHVERSAARQTQLAARRTGGVHARLAIRGVERHQRRHVLEHERASAQPRAWRQHREQDVRNWLGGRACGRRCRRRGHGSWRRVLQLAAACTPSSVQYVTLVSDAGSVPATFTAAAAWENTQVALQEVCIQQTSSTDVSSMHQCRHQQHMPQGKKEV